MAYVPGYKYDIFISFTHADNDPLPGVTVAGSTSFTINSKTS